MMQESKVSRTYSTHRNYWPALWACPGILKGYGENTKVL